MPPLLPLLAILSPTGQRGWLITALLAVVIAIPFLSGVLIRGRCQGDATYRQLQYTRAKTT